MSTPAAASSRATTTDREAMEKFGQARWVVAALWPFYTRLVMRLCPRWTTECPTVAVDGDWRVYLNPDWVKKQHVSTIALVLAGHELGHCLGSHSERLRHLDGVWLDVGGGPVTAANVAHDLAVNSGLQAFVDAAVRIQQLNGSSNPQIPVAVPPEGLYPHKFLDEHGKRFPEGLLSEQYADLLMRAAGKSPRAGYMACGKPDKGREKGGSKAPGCGRCGSGGGGEKEDYEDQTPADPDDSTTGVSATERDTLRQMTAQAIREQSARQAGTVPGHMELWADVLLKPSKVPWQRLLDRAVRSAVNWLAGQGDYSYKVRNKREGGGVILPGHYRPAPKFVVALDCSGSMTTSDYQESFSQIAAILRAAGERRVPVFTCDTKASDVQYVNDVRQIRMVGGGGTDMAVAVSKAAEEGYKLVIVCTDGYTGWGPQPVGVKVIACMTRRGNRPPDWVTTVECFDD